MKKNITTLLLIFTFFILVSINLINASNLYQVQVNRYGVIKKALLTFNPNGKIAKVFINNTGNLENLYSQVSFSNFTINCYLNGEISALQYPNNKIYYNNGKIQQIGNTKFYYYNNGKIQQIGNTKFYYYNNGKILQIGNTKFYYYNNGKILQIGNTKFYYYNNGKIQQIGNTKFYYYNNGKILQIGNTKFYYYNNGKIQQTSGTSNISILITD